MAESHRRWTHPCGAGWLAPLREAALRNKTVHGHPILVRQLAADADVKRCAVLFVGCRDGQEIARVVQSLGRSPILSIGERTQFSRLGGVVAFIRDDNQIRFEINRDAAGRVRN